MVAQRSLEVPAHKPDYQDSLRLLRSLRLRDGNRLERYQRAVLLLDRVRKDKRLLSDLAAHIMTTPDSLFAWLGQVADKCQAGFIEESLQQWRQIICGMNYRGRGLPVTRCLFHLELFVATTADEAPLYGLSFDLAVARRVEKSLKQILARYGDVTPEELEQMGGPVRDSDPEQWPRLHRWH